jgi:hypothetical protein
VDRCVVHQTRVRGDGLAAGLADVRIVIAACHPLALTVVVDALSDDRAHCRIGRRTHQRCERARKEAIVGIEEGKPLAACDRQAPIAGVRHTAVHREPEQGDSSVAFRDGRHDVGGPVRRCVVDDDALERDITFGEDRSERPLDRRAASMGRAR